MARGRNDHEGLGLRYSPRQDLIGFQAWWEGLDQESRKQVQWPRDLEGLDLSSWNLTQANMTGACLYDAVLTEIEAPGVNLSHADLSGANLVNANLEGADLSNADLSGANLSGANLIKANLQGANFRYANLANASVAAALFEEDGFDLAHAAPRGLRKDSLLISCPGHEDYVMPRTDLVILLQRFIQITLFTAKDKIKSLESGEVVEVGVDSADTDDFRQELESLGLKIELGGSYHEPKPMAHVRLSAQGQLNVPQAIQAISKLFQACPEVQFTLLKAQQVVKELEAGNESELFKYNGQSEDLANAIKELQEANIKLST